MHFLTHSSTAVPFLLIGMPEAALGCVLPDIAWMPHEICYRTSQASHFGEYEQTRLTWLNVLPYRITHSFFFCAICYALCPALALGCFIHILLDLPTHFGFMQQRPFFPIAWRWPWLFPKPLCTTTQHET